MHLCKYKLDLSNKLVREHGEEYTERLMFLSDSVTFYTEALFYGFACYKNIKLRKGWWAAILCGFDNMDKGNSGYISNGEFRNWLVNKNISDLFHSLSDEFY